jgi:membrane fusion protein, multidrug efflux system
MHKQLMKRLPSSCRSRRGLAALATSCCSPLLAILVVITLTACSRPASEPAQPRPVKTVLIGAESQAGWLQLAGEVKARYEARVGFRVGGKILRRHINVGDRIKTGTTIAELDATDYRLAAESIAAQLKAAQADFVFAQDDLQRYRELRDQQLISSAEFDRHETTTATLRERVATLRAQLEQAKNQVAYTRLAADHEGIVVAVLAEADQVVAAGQAVAVLARPDELEIAIDVPEDRRDAFAQADAIDVSFWARPGAHLRGRLRELSASANPASRMYAARVSLPARPEWVRLGMSATAQLRNPASTGHAIPLSAVFQHYAEAGGEARVWVVNPAGTAVSNMPIRLGAPTGENEVIVYGLVSGQRIVTAGTSRLHEGAPVKLLGPPGLGASPIEREATAQRSVPTPSSVAAEPNPRRGQSR